MCIILQMFILYVNRVAEHLLSGETRIRVLIITMRDPKCSPVRLQFIMDILNNEFVKMTECKIS